jgi:hypothetical protein
MLFKSIPVHTSNFMSYYYKNRQDYPMMNLVEIIYRYYLNFLLMKLKFHSDKEYFPINSSLKYLNEFVDRLDFLVHYPIFYYQENYGMKHFE